MKCDICAKETRLNWGDAKYTLCENHFGSKNLPDAVEDRLDQKAVEEARNTVGMRKSYYTLGRLVSFLFLSPFIVIVVALLGYAINKAYWDMKVGGMCTVDGGATIFERVELSNDEYEKIIDDRGWISIPNEEYAKPDDLFYSTYSSVYLRRGSPDIFRREQSLVRASDGKVLSSKVSYSRRGGDFPVTIGHHSSFGCGNEADVINTYKSAIQRRLKN